MRRFGGAAAGFHAKRQWLCRECLNVTEHKVSECERCQGPVDYFQSKKEMNRWRELLLLEQAGHISDLQRQIVFRFQKHKDKRAICTPKGHVMKHVVDFSYVRDGVTLYEDTKGVDTELGYLKRQIVNYMHNVSIRVV